MLQLNNFQAWEEHLTSKLKEAGAQEKKIAEEKGHYLNGVPYVTATGDGGWGKRTYGHGYNSSSGVVSINSWLQYYSQHFTGNHNVPLILNFEN